MAVLRSHASEGVAQEMWALFAVYQAIPHPDRRRGRRHRRPTREDQLPACPGRRDRLRHRGFPPHNLDLALATFLLKILDSNFFVRDRPDRASPRATRRPVTSPPAKTDPASSASPGASDSTASDPGHRAIGKAIGHCPRRAGRPPEWRGCGANGLRAPVTSRDAPARTPSSENTRRHGPSALRRPRPPFHRSVPSPGGCSYVKSGWLASLRGSRAALAGRAGLPGWGVRFIPLTSWWATTPWPDRKPGEQT